MKQKQEKFLVKLVKLFFKALLKKKIVPYTLYKKRAKFLFQPFDMYIPIWQCLDIQIEKRFFPFDLFNWQLEFQNAIFQRHT